VSVAQLTKVSYGIWDKNIEILKSFVKGGQFFFSHVAQRNIEKTTQETRNTIIPMQARSPMLFSPL
jgi:hypothetical protein